VSGLRELKKQRQRQEIIDAAVALFHDRGYGETRVQDILDRAEISLGTFYNYFEGKAAVLDGYAAALIGAYAEFAREGLEAKGDSVADRIRGLSRACAQAFTADPDFMTVVVTRSKHFGVSGQLPSRDVAVYGYLEQLFAEGQASGEVRDDVDALELAEIYSGNFIFTAIGWLIARAAGRREDLEPRLDRVMDVFLAGCRPQ
jgi:AcrR family transcriptional regulator